MQKSISSDGSIVFWDSCRISRAIVTKAFGDVGMSSLVPSIDYFAALKNTTAQIVDVVGLRTSGRVHYDSLAHDRNAVGVEVRRKIKGKTKNELPFLFSLGVVETAAGGYEVAVLEADGKECPDIIGNKAEIERTATSVWQACCDYLTANDLTNALTALVRKQCGVMLRDGGVVWYLTKDKLEPYRSISAALAPHGPKLQMGVFDPVVNKDLVDHVCNELEKRGMDVFKRMVEEAEDMRLRGARPRPKGQQSRLEEWIETHNTIEHMKKVFGRTFVGLTKAAQAARRAIGSEGIRMMRESA